MNLKSQKAHLFFPLSKGVNFLRTLPLFFFCPPLGKLGLGDLEWPLFFCPKSKVGHKKVVGFFFFPKWKNGKKIKFFLAPRFKEKKKQKNWGLKFFNEKNAHNENGILFKKTKN